MNSTETKKIIHGVIDRYLIKDYHITVKAGEVILWLPEKCKEKPYDHLSDEANEALDDNVRITIIYPNNGKCVSEFIHDNLAEIKRMKLI